MRHLRLFLIIIIYTQCSWGLGSISGWCEQGNSLVTASGTGGTAAPYGPFSFTGTSITILASTHKQGPTPFVEVYDSMGYNVSGQIAVQVSNVGTVVIGGASTTSDTYTYTIYGALGTPTGGPISRFYQQSYPQCTITVYQTGTLTLAPLFSTNTTSPTPLSNPFSGNFNGYYQAFAAEGLYDVQISQGGLPAPFTLGSESNIDPNFEPPNLWVTNGAVVNRTKNAKLADFMDILDFGADPTGNTDISTALNNAYASLTAAGGTIWFPPGIYKLSVGVNFNTNNKPVLLQGSPGNAVVINYTATSGTAITFDYGTGLTMGKGLRDIALVGTGPTATSVGLNIGGTVNGAQGTAIYDFKIDSFGVGVTFGSNTWIVKLGHGLIRNSGNNVIFPSSCVGCGENIQWDHITFADAPAPFTNSVWLQAGEHKMTDCSFDQAQLSIGNGTTSHALVSVVAGHFENPNYAANSTHYDFITQSNNGGNHLSLVSPFFNQDDLNPAHGPFAEFITTNGGELFAFGIEMFTPIGPVTQLITANNQANVTVYGFNDESGQTTSLVGGNSTGYLVQFPGTDPGQTNGLNNVIGPGAGTNRGGSILDVTGNIRSSYSASVPFSGQLISEIPTGNSPIVVNSTTPVTNLFSNYILYTGVPTPTPASTTTKILAASFTLSGGTYNVIFPGGIFTNSSSYFCNATDTSAKNPMEIELSSGTAFTISGTGSDSGMFICTGF